MAKSITSINSLLVKIKTTNHTLLFTLQQQGFNTQLNLGPEQEYTVKTLVGSINSLAIQLLTITANRNQFIQRTCFTERLEIETHLSDMLSCLQHTTQTLKDIKTSDYQCDTEQALFYIVASKPHPLELLNAVDIIEKIKPFSRMLDSITTQERIHSLSAVLESLLSKIQLIELENSSLTEEKNDALELSQHLMRQAL